MYSHGVGEIWGLVHSLGLSAAAHARHIRPMLRAKPSARTAEHGSEARCAAAAQAGLLARGAPRAQTAGLHLPQTPAAEPLRQPPLIQAASGNDSEQELFQAGSSGRSLAAGTLHGSAELARVCPAPQAQPQQALPRLLFGARGRWRRLRGLFCCLLAESGAGASAASSEQTLEMGRTGFSSAPSHSSPSWPRNPFPRSRCTAAPALARPVPSGRHHST